MSHTLNTQNLALALLLSCCVPCAHAQTPATKPAGAETQAPVAPTQAPPLPAPYLLADGDVISITVVNFPELSKQITVPPDGKLSFSLLQPFSATGMTPEQLAQTLTEQWRKYVINPSVSVSILQKRKENVLIYGYVLRPGIAEYRPPMRLLEALAQVGGAMVQGDLSQVTLTHKSGSKLVVDVSHPAIKQGTTADVSLDAGDVIYVPERRIQINVVGEVKIPGALEYRDDMNVMDAVAAAGGVTESADLAAATLLHDGKERKLDLDAMYRHGDTTANVKLAPGDRLLIPEIKDRTYVFGAVARPGFFHFKPGDRILDAMNACGGPLSDGDLRRVNLIHIAQNKQSAVMQQVNVDKFLHKADMTFNVALQPGDVVYVPEKKKTLGINDLWGLMAGFNLVTGVTRIFVPGFGQ